LLALVRDGKCADRRERCAEGMLIRGTQRSQETGQPVCPGCPAPCDEIPARVSDLDVDDPSVGGISTALDQPGI